MDTRNGNYDIYSAKSIELTLLTPNGGESILKGTTYEIRWRSNYSVDNVLIEYSLNNGQNWGPVEACNVGSTGSYFWSVPDVISEECLVRISYSNHLNVSDTSDIAFEISDCSFKGDLSGDCFVDFLDLAFLAGNWLKSGLRRIFYFNLNEDPNWTKEGQWQFGQPAGAGGIYGKPDPNSGYTGNNVYGVNLNGDYSTAAGGPYYLTIGPLDCSQYSNVKLKFYRWLNTDIPDYVSSRIEVSNNGADWVNIWEHTGSSDIADDTWQFKEYDISSAADGKSTIYIRWGYEILDEHAFSYSGWNIDDVQLLGTR